MESHLIWYIIAGFLLLAEAFTPGMFIFICFAIATLICGVLDQVFVLDIKVLLAIDLVLSLALLVFVKPILKTIIKMPKSSETLYANKLVGHEAMVFKPISKNETGMVKLLDIDETWLAKSKDGSEIGQGTTVKVVEVDGTHLVVECI